MNLIVRSVLLLAMLSGQAWAQTPVDARIRAVLGTGSTLRPIPQLLVSVIRPEGDTLRAVTDMDGYAVLRLVPSTYLVTAELASTTGIASHTWRIGWVVGQEASLLLLSERNSLREGLFQLDPITVSAERRDEGIQWVPFGVSALDGTQLLDRGARGFESFAPRITGLQVFGIGQGNLQLAARGIVTERQRSNRSNTVSIYMDDIPIDLSGANPNYQLFDIERVEFLKGPQGTLYGAGAEAGALRIMTRMPQLGVTSFYGGFDATATEGGTPGTTVYGTANVPVGRIGGALRATAYFRRDGGFLDNITTGVRNTNAVSIAGGRVTAKALIGNRMEAILSVFAQINNDRDSDWSNAEAGRFVRTTDVFEKNRSLNTLMHASGVYRLPEGVLAAILGFHNNDFTRDLEVGRYPVLLGAQPGQFAAVVLPTTLRSNGLSQEVRFTTAASNAFRLVAGIFHSATTSSTRQTLDVPGMEAAVPSLPLASEYDLPKDRLYSGEFRVGGDQLASYMDLTVPVTRSLSLAGGLRLYSYKLNANVDYRGALQGAVDTTSPMGSESGVNPRLNLSYKFQQNIMAYIQISKGTRVGGANEPLPLDACTADLAAIGLDEAPPTFASDRVWNYELGLKGADIASGASFSLALFNMQAEDIQVTQRLACTYSIVRNSGRMRSTGLEVDVDFRPTGSLSFVGSLTAINSRLTTTPGPFLGDPGRKAPYVPRIAYSVSVSYQGPAHLVQQPFVSLEYSYTGRRETDFREQASLPMSGYGVVNARVGVRRSAWSLFVFGMNLGNSVGVGDRTTSSASAIQFIRTTAIRPRTLGVGISVNPR